VSDPHSGSDHWFEPIAEHLGSAYLRYSFTKGTRQEVDFLVEVLELAPGSRVLDVGCGPGRHALELARRGITVLGLDISQRFVDLATEAAIREGLSGASFVRADARDLESTDVLPGDGDPFDAAICLCQGAFGLMRSPGEDRRVLAGIARWVRPGGRLALSAFNAYFSVKYHEGATFDADLGVSHERTVVKSEQGEDREVDLWTGCFTPRELRLLAEESGWKVSHVWSVDPGSYRRETPTVESSEFLVVSSRGAGLSAP
jgi:SAM-dependent methyltransferase